MHHTELDELAVGGRWGEGLREREEERRERWRRQAEGERPKSP